MDLMEALGPLPGPDANDQAMEDLMSDPAYSEDVLTDKDLAEDPPGHKSGYAALIGRPNAGKSTLLNSLVGEKLSIVSPKAQTTRQRVLAFCSHKDYQARPPACSVLCHALWRVGVQYGAGDRGACACESQGLHVCLRSAARCTRLQWHLPTCATERTNRLLLPCSSSCSTRPAWWTRSATAWRAR